MVIHSDRHLTARHARRHIAPQSFKITVSTPGEGDGILRRQDMLFPRSRYFSATGSERFEINQVTHCSYDLLSYIVLLPRDTFGYHLELQPRIFLFSWRQSPRRALFMLYASNYSSNTAGLKLFCKAVVSFNNMSSTSFLNLSLNF